MKVEGSGCEVTKLLTKLQVEVGFENKIERIFVKQFSDVVCQCATVTTLPHLNGVTPKIELVAEAIDGSIC